MVPDAQQLMAAESRGCVARVSYGCCWQGPAAFRSPYINELGDYHGSSRFRHLFAGTTSCSTWKSSSLPLLEERRWPGGCVRQKGRLPRSLQCPQAPPEAELISWPCPGMWQGSSQLSSCCPPPQPSLRSAGRHWVFVLL